MKHFLGETCQVGGLRLPPGHTEKELAQALAARLGAAFGDWRILRRSLDARGRPMWEYTLGVALPEGVRPPASARALPWRERRLAFTPPPGPLPAPLVVGAGPGGIFAALRLAEYGFRPLVLERGRPVDQRMRDVAGYWRTGRPDPDSNVLFGEGGAGAFSDGKLTSRTKDADRKAWVLQKLVEAGAPPEILYEAKPHLGTDRLRAVVAGLRGLLSQRGGEARFAMRAESLLLRGGEVAGLRTNRGDLDGPAVFLACGHSAPDFVKTLAGQGVAVSPKPFALGLRVELPQEEVDASRYGRWAGDRELPPAEFAVTHATGDGRGVFSFCMCPGGTVIPCGTEPEGLVVNGMSGARRAGRWANAALVVETRVGDFWRVGDDPLSGFAFQRHWEQAASSLAGTRAVPAQPVVSFLGGGDAELGRSTCPWPLAGVEVARCLPGYASAALAEALPALARSLPPLARGRLLGVETRTSSPVRIERGDDLQSVTVPGLYPVGEGAGAAGGIVSAAIDGARAADAYAASLGGCFQLV